MNPSFFWSHADSFWKRKEVSPAHGSAVVVQSHPSFCGEVWCVVAKWLVGGGGGQNVPCDEGGKRTIECSLQSQFWRHQKVGFVWSVPVSCKENDRA